MKSHEGSPGWVRRTYVAFHPTLLYFPTGCVKRAKDRNPLNVKAPRNAQSFRFFDVISVVVVVDGEKVELKSEQRNHSPEYHCGGKTYTLSMLQRSRLLNKQELIADMKRGGLKKVIRYPNGQWNTIGKDDIVLKSVA